MRPHRPDNIVDVRCPQTNKEEAGENVNLSTPVSLAKAGVQSAEARIPYCAGM